MKVVVLVTTIYTELKKMGKGGFEPPTAQFRTEINAETLRFQYHTKLDHLPVKKSVGEESPYYY